jgi:hypothetical protein
MIASPIFLPKKWIWFFAERIFNAKSEHLRYENGQLK